MKLFVEFHPTSQVMLVFEADGDRLRLVDLDVSDVLHRQRGGGPIETMPDNDDVVHLLPIQLTHDPASMGIMGYETLGHQIPNRLTDRRSAQLELLSDLGLDDSGATGQVTSQNCAADRLSCVFVGGPTTQLTNPT